MDGWTNDRNKRVYGTNRDGQENVQTNIPFFSYTIGTS